MFKETGYSPEEIKKFEKTREETEIELIKGGAEHDENGRLVVTAEQWSRSYEEMKSEIEKKTIEEHTNWLQQHPQEAGIALVALGGGSFMALAGMSAADIMPETLQSMSEGVTYAIITLQMILLAGGTALVGVGDKLSKKWKNDALEKGREEDRNKKIREQIKSAREQQ